MYYDRAVAELHRRIPGLQIRSIGGACPFQAQGRTPDNNEFYFRFRHDEATLYVYPVGADYFEEAIEYSKGTTNSGYDRGDLDSDDVIELFEKLWKKRRPMEEFEHMRKPEQTS
jgi:hypothetical protein